ncbi:GAF domain-containing protein [Kribbella sp. NBC_00889]|uniref:GAF domain-containing protein n=1 Tax=Kribbella sp. NBC_00889 TaxID=2975974 RepID=UPI003869AB82|nr:GAF domain-containing protein [Kribbella sp. NBC_00889]
MSSLPHPRRVPRVAEIVLAFLAGAGTFVVVAVLAAWITSDALIVILAVPLVTTVVLVTKLIGIAYAVPIAMAGMLAYDWYHLTPTHPLGFPGWSNLVDLLVYLAVSVLIGELAAHATRQAQTAEVARAELADEQAALRRVATGVAEGVPAQELLAAVAEEAGTLLDVDATRIVRYEDDDLAHVTAWSRPGYDPRPYDRVRLEGRSVAGDVRRTGRVARIDDYDDIEDRLPLTRGLRIKSVAGAPIVVGGDLWGVMVVWSMAEPLPAATESRLTDFTELAATAIANLEARRQVERLLDEQAALRRVATLVARGGRSAEVVETVIREVGVLCGADLARLERYETDGTVTGVGVWSRNTDHQLSSGTRFVLQGPSIAALVRETGRPMRVDSFAGASGPIAQEAQGLGIRSSVGCPVVVQGRLWGVIAASSTGDAPFPPDTESQIGEFTELLATAISNLKAHADLEASRARIVQTTDLARRRFERDLHDGVQQRLVSLGLELRGVEAAAAPDLRAGLAQISSGLDGVFNDLRELSRGIHPAILSEGGLDPALRALGRRSAVAVKLDVNVGERLAERVEVAAYYVVSEALTNTAKYAEATLVEIQVALHDDVLELSIRDDGIGGADPARGSGLIGLTDRVEALGGRISITSPVGEGTSLHVELPLEVA